MHGLTVNFNHPPTKEVSSVSYLLRNADQQSGLDTDTCMTLEKNQIRKCRHSSMVREKVFRSRRELKINRCRGSHWKNIYLSGDNPYRVNKQQQRPTAYTPAFAKSHPRLEKKSYSVTISTSSAIERSSAQAEGMTVFAWVHTGSSVVTRTRRVLHHSCNMNKIKLKRLTLQVTLGGQEGFYFLFFIFLRFVFQKWLNRGWSTESSECSAMQYMLPRRYNKRRSTERWEETKGKWVSDVEYSTFL